MKENSGHLAARKGVSPTIWLLIVMVIAVIVSVVLLISFGKGATPFQKIIQGGAEQRSCTAVTVTTKIACETLKCTWNPTCGDYVVVGATATTNGCCTGV